MLSESHEGRRRNRTWVWALPLSAAVHAVAVPWALWAFSQHLLFVTAQLPPETVVASTAVRLERRPVPQPRQAPARPAMARPATQPQQPAAAVPARAPAVREEIARERPDATPEAQTPAPTAAQRVARDQQMFSREVAAMNKANASLSIATAAPQPPSTFQRSYFDVPGNRTRQTEQMLLFPARHWEEGDASCYYVSYTAQFSNGANEQGVVPWPVCYPRGNDPIAKYPYPGVPLPIPYPPAGFTVPSGTYMSVYLRRIYLHQI